MIFRNTYRRNEGEMVTYLGMSLFSASWAEDDATRHARVQSYDKHPCSTSGQKLQISSLAPEHSATCSSSLRVFGLSNKRFRPKCASAAAEAAGSGEGSASGGVQHARRLSQNTNKENDDNVALGVSIGSIASAPQGPE
jgi:hypothetical protein